MKRRFIRWESLGALTLGCRSIIKVAVAMALIATAFAANAVQVILVTHNQTSGSGTISTLITDGVQINGPGVESDAVWDWDGVTLTSIGLYTATGSIRSSRVTAVVLTDWVTDLSIDTGTSTASGTAYECIEGNFLRGVGANGCGGYDLGPNFADESVTTWGPGLMVAQQLNVNPALPPAPGDDFSTDGPRTIAEYNFVLDSVTGTGLAVGDMVRIGNGVPVGTVTPPPAEIGGELLTFVVTASAIDDTAQVKPNQSVNIPVLDNDTLTDPISDLQVTVAPASGSLTLNGTLPDSQANLSFDYAATAVLGDVTFEYEVTDADGNPLTAMVTVTVTGVVANDDGTMGAPAFTVETGATVPLDVLANDVGLVDPQLTVVPVAPTATLGTTAVIGSPGDANSISVGYTAGQNVGVDSFGYQVSDTSGDMDSAVVYVEVISPSVPVAVDDDATTVVDEVVDVNVLANDTGLDDVPLTVTITSDPTSGSVANCTIQGMNCVIRYTPNAGFVGTDSFRYKVTDSTPDESNEATVTITVDPIPVTADDTASTTSDRAVTIDVLLNDPSQGKQPFTITPVPLASTKGTPAVRAGNTILYLPSGGSERDDAFDYTVTDANGQASTARVTVTITPVQGDLAGESSALSPVGLGLLALLTWLRRRRG